MTSPKILIVGFGRSGTTWLSDIISKSIGGLMLFEPFHPQVCPFAEQITYRADIDVTRAHQHIDDLLTKPTDIHPWLLRNTLTEPINDTPDQTINYILDHTPRIGYKTVRGLHCFDSLAGAADVKTLYIHRHPLCVITSINGRPNFWKEFGWDWHQQHYLSRALTSRYLLPETQAYLKMLPSSDPASQAHHLTMAMMWSVSFIIGLRQAESIGAKIISYEDLYLRPYENVQDILGYIGAGQRPVHPSYMFTPSMTTMRTYHMQRAVVNMERDELVHSFIEGRVDPEQITAINSRITEILQTDPEIAEKGRQKGYL